ncbi:MAG: C40 family peptidase [Alphaproteobacteria bacterium]
MSDSLDPRLHAFRPDLADERLAGRVSAMRFVAGERRRVVAGNAALKPTADDLAPTSTELLFGETFTVFDDKAGWSWGQLETDGYVGYARSEALAAPGREATHRVTVLGTFLYGQADLKSPPLASLSLGSCLVLGDEVEVRAVSYRLVEGGGAVVGAHVASVDGAPENDFVAVAERFLNTPYLWGGRSRAGVDCSSLVQLSLMAAGVAAPRDSDQQEAGLGQALEGGAAAVRRPGDLVFWPGHVGIMIDGEYMIHASGHHMMVVIEPLAEAMQRIAAHAGPPTSVKRLTPQ